jgi:hypothetical protein
VVRKILAKKQDFNQWQFNNSAETELDGATQFFPADRLTPSRS